MAIRIALSIAFAAAVVGAAPQPQHKRLAGSVVQNCRFSLGPRVYNLCPLFAGSDHHEWTVALETQTPPTLTTMTYRIALDGPLKLDARLPEHEQCEKGTWVCMTATNRRPEHRSEPDRITQLIPVVSNSTVSNKDGRPGAEAFGIFALEGAAGADKPGSLQLVMRGGYYVDKPQRSLIRFSCVGAASSQHKPTYAWSWNGTHTFDWKTQHACAHAQAHKPEPEPQHGADDPPDVESPPKDGEQLLPPVGPRISLLGVTAAIVCTASALCALVYALMHPPAFARQRLAPYARKLGRAARRLRRWRGRPGEVKLIRWAEEDLPVFGLPDDIDTEDGEEGEMVNAREMAEGDGVEERIPLKPSPGLGFGYGAVPKTGR
ncbi:hypothetical protein K488DRAFT_87667 [Vararia minispora EC-137]|uniref:Uncharacterized protein n=1 Tax=Vararia minispora EC-137 TaxID=1314806 RepID=A0ACB8QG47_9AGAM|nr:hypothetical protein K488DRAFT_87667 [Vararia minispora EC-137]